MKKTTLLLSIVCILVVVDCHPSFVGTRITFSNAKIAENDDIEVNTDLPQKDSQEYYGSLLTVAVTREGMQYEGTLQEVMETINPSTSQDVGDTIPHDREDILSSDSFRAISQALRAEKRSIQGTDERILVSPPNRFPYTAIGRLDNGCTGTFIAPKAVITSGRCVFNNGQWLLNLDISRNKDCDDNLGVRHYWRYAVTLAGWQYNSYVTHDIGVIFYSTSSSAGMRYDAFVEFSSQDIFNVAGYPVDKFGRCLWRSYCKPNYKFIGNLLSYQCDTYEGMSGSPFYGYSGISDQRILYGVHGSVVNTFAVTISREYKNIIDNWISKNY